MIKTFKHKKLEQFFVSNIKKWLDMKDLPRISRMLDRLDAATAPIDMNIPGWDFHELKGDRKGTYSVAVRKNWKITFRFYNGDAVDINLEDYH